eukprot:1017173-Rhodomonas_salina.1
MASAWCDCLVRLHPHPHRLRRQRWRNPRRARCRRTPRGRPSLRAGCVQARFKARWREIVMYSLRPALIGGLTTRTTAKMSVKPRTRDSCSDLPSSTSCSASGPNSHE